MALVVAGHPINATEGQDKITSTDKITSPYFTDSIVQWSAGDIYTASLSDTNETYYYGISKDNVTGSVQFTIAYGNVNGKGGNSDSDNIKSPTEVIYKQWGSILLAENEVTGGFKISQAGSSGVVSSGTKDDQIYVMVAKRTNMKDRLNKKNWTIALSGSHNSGLGGLTDITSSIFYFTDDSNTTSPTATPAGPRYNIVSGSQGSVHTAATTKTFGWFYPDQGVMVWSGAELSASLPGSSSAKAVAATYSGDGLTGRDWAGFGFDNSSEDADYNNGLRFVNCLKGVGAYVKFRDEEDQTSVQYFCRVKAGQANFSNSPSFVSGSLNEIRQKTMKGNPTVYITGVELYNAAGNMVATGKLSTPLKKNFSSEATIKVKLTY